MGLIKPFLLGVFTLEVPSAGLLRSKLTKVRFDEVEPSFFHQKHLATIGWNIPHLYPFLPNEQFISQGKQNPYTIW
jgi:hypothetical protein